MTELADISLHRVSTAEAVADALVGLIVSGTLRAGEPLRESSLATKLGISRNSLREAIRLLERSRLVKYEIHRGAIVSTPTLTDLEDLYRTRRQLELAGVLQEPSEEQLAAITAAFTELQNTATHQVAEPIVAADLALHQAIVDLLGSERLSSFYRQICKELVFYFTVLSYTDEEYIDPEISIVSRHQGIYDAIISGDRELAHALLEQHIEENHARLREILTNRLEAEQE
ncbi:GntR family transcriptional regulator [Leucobacter sp. CSA2]|uniref:GntR family transcriptional regulator n=1 Tax=Leucobacter edaphi TaxID=2796472 RepID=A0A934UXR3_9MICO|nr:GntR family transcriptional regulator [Leucobacter edaphi]MBK0421896.1 GntR family transcriptional regulator [Leucobacter edaphi]